jgi:hypothetical protein
MPERLLQRLVEAPASGYKVLESERSGFRKERNLRIKVLE